MEPQKTLYLNVKRISFIGAFKCFSTINWVSHVLWSFYSFVPMSQQRSWNSTKAYFWKVRSLWAREVGILQREKPSSFCVLTLYINIGHTDTQIRENGSQDRVLLWYGVNWKNAYMYCQVFPKTISLDDEEARLPWRIHVRLFFGYVDR